MIPDFRPAGKRGKEEKEEENFHRHSLLLPPSLPSSFRVYCQGETMKEKAQVTEVEEVDVPQLLRSLRESVRPGS